MDFHSVFTTSRNTLKLSKDDKLIIPFFRLGSCGRYDIVKVMPISTPSSIEEPSVNKKPAHKLRFDRNQLARVYRILIAVLAVIALVMVLAVFQPLEFFFQKSTRTPSFPQSTTSLQSLGNQENQQEDYFADAANLPSCGDKKELFTVFPLKLTDFKGIVPLGTLAPTAHVLPTHHLFFHPRRVDPNNFNSLPAEVPALSPGNITITEIKFTSSAQNPNLDDGVIVFAPCRELKGYLDHFKTFSPTLKKAYDEGQLIRCDEYQKSYQKFGTVNWKLCIKKVNLHVKAGEQLGTAGGGEGQMVFDFGLFDKRVPQAPLANPKRWLGQEYKVSTVCPLDYYPPELKDQLKSRLGTPDGTKRRTIEPVCGTANWDLPGTAQGVWILKGEEYVAHENPHLALAYDNTDPNIAVISMGNSAQSKGFAWGTYNFNPQASGLINRDFKDIKDNQVYCFETDDTYRQNARAVILIQMPTDKTLKIEKTNLSSCDTGPWQIKNYTEFNR